MRNGGRESAVAATGSGKTLIAAGCARRPAPQGVVLVLVPTTTPGDSGDGQAGRLRGRRLDAPPAQGPQAFGADQAAKLDALDELWRLEPDWNRSYRRLLAYLAAGGTLDGPADRTGPGDDPTFRPGTWPHKQDKAGPQPRCQCHADAGEDRHLLGFSVLGDDEKATA
ncbi:hypothetical protein AB0A71_34570 [Kitasatospora aureofaciens]|uniref:hypothetical protein n=1 Tax=Kitasatospora aureofaciens TaxID=1894 RepID=UPI0034007580